MNQEQQLHLAVREEDQPKIKDLLSAGVDINCLFYGWTPLQLAINQGFEDLAIELIDHGCDIYKQHDKKDPSAFESAIKKKLPKVTKALLNNGVDPNMTLTDGNPAIFLTVENGTIEILKVLIEGKADVNIKNSSGETSLYVACTEGLTDIVQILIEAGASIDFICEKDDNKTPLITAVANEHDSVVKILLKNGCNINHQDSDSWTALWYAYSNCDEVMMTLLLKSGADKNIPDSDDRTLLQDAEENEDEEIIELLNKFPGGGTVS